MGRARRRIKRLRAAGHVDAKKYAELLPETRALLDAVERNQRWPNRLARAARRWFVRRNKRWEAEQAEFQRKEAKARRDRPKEKKPRPERSKLAPRADWRPKPRVRRVPRHVESSKQLEQRLERRLRIRTPRLTMDPGQTNPPSGHTTKGARRRRANEARKAERAAKRGARRGRR
jgi:hypothetical protein